MSKINAVHLTFKGPHPFIGGKWAIKPLPFEDGLSAAVATFTAGLPGVWVAEPAPFIITHDPNPPQVLTAVYDSTTVRTIGKLSSTSPEAVAAYDDGLFNNIAEAQRLYPNHEVISICVKFGDRAMWGDCENGDMTSEEALHAFAMGLLSKGIYANLDRWERELVPLLQTPQFFNLPCLRWVADWTGVPHLPRLSDGVMAAACQYDNHVAGRVNTDVSIFTSDAL